MKAWTFWIMGPSSLKGPTWRIWAQETSVKFSILTLLTWPCLFFFTSAKAHTNNYDTPVLIHCNVAINCFSYFYSVECPILNSIHFNDLTLWPSVWLPTGSPNTPLDQRVCTKIERVVTPQADDMAFYGSKRRKLDVIHFLSCCLYPAKIFPFIQNFMNN